MAAPSVYSAITAITAELANSGVPKTRINQDEDYKYRSIDDLLNRLAPLLGKHRLCILPRVLQREVILRDGADQQVLTSVILRVGYTLVSSDDGSSHVVEAYGEALDGSDKGTPKAMSAAYKAAMVQVFCIPVGETADTDRNTASRVNKAHPPEPVQGWEQWTRDIADIVDVCQSEQAVDTVQDRNRELLKALSRERAELYAGLGELFTERRKAIRNLQRPKTRRKSPATGTIAEPSGA